MVSIIIPLYNRADLITETLDTLISRRHKDVELEVIIIDDGSTDAEPTVITKEYPWVRLLTQKKQGAPTARNFGLREAKGEYILYLDSDDLIEENYFIEKVKVLNNDNSAVGVYGPWEYFDSRTKSIIPRHSPYPIISQPESNEHLKKLLGGWFIPCNAMIWRRDFLLELKGQREDLIINQDVDLMFRALINGKIIGIDSPKALIRQHTSDRVGILNSEKKFEAILELRKEFVKLLKSSHMANQSLLQPLGRYLFNLWAANRRLFPDTATQCLLLSKVLYPDLKLKGGRLLRMLNYFLGAILTIKIKSLLQGENIK